MHNFKKKPKPSPHNPELDNHMLTWYVEQILEKGITRNNKQWWAPSINEPNWAGMDKWDSVSNPAYVTKSWGGNDLCNYFAREMIDKMQSANLVQVAINVASWHKVYNFKSQTTKFGTDLDWMFFIAKTFHDQPNNITIPKHIEFNGHKLQTKHLTAMIMCDTIDRIFAQQQ